MSLSTIKPFNMNGETPYTSDTVRPAIHNFLDEALQLRTRLMYGVTCIWIALSVLGMYILVLNQFDHQASSSRLSSPHSTGTPTRKANTRARGPTAPQLGVNAKTEADMWNKLTQWLEQQEPKQGMCWIAPQDLSKNSKIKLNYPIRCTGQAGNKQGELHSNTNALQGLTVWSLGFSSLDLNHEVSSPQEHQAQEMSLNKADGWFRTPKGQLLYQPDQEKWMLKP